MPDRIDLIVVDGPPANSHKDARYPALPLLADKMSKRAAILMDDGRREKRIAIQWVREYPEFWMEEIPTERDAIILRNYKPE